MSGSPEKKMSEDAQNAKASIGIKRKKQPLKTTIKEVFIPIKGYEDCYMISNHGRVLSNKKRPFGIILNNQNNAYGYHHVLLFKNGKRKTKLIHQMVIDAFYPILRIGSKLLVDHIDNNRKNNMITNLRLVDFRENQINRIDSIKFTSRFPGVSLDRNAKKKIWKSMKQINGIQIYLGHFKTETEAANAYINAGK